MAGEHTALVRPEPPTKPSQSTVVQAIATAAGPPARPPPSTASSPDRPGRGTAASVWSSPGSHGVLEEGRDDARGLAAAADPFLALPDDDDHLASAWGAAAEAAVAGLADPSTAPAALASLAADPHSPADICDSPSAWAGLMAALPGVLGRAETAQASAALVVAVASSAAAEAPGLLPHLASAAVRGLAGGEAPPAASGCVLTLLSSTLPRAWTAFRPPELKAAADAVAAAVRREGAGAPSPPLDTLASADPSWLRRWGATSRLAGPLWAAVGRDQLALHVAALDAGGGGTPARRLSAVLVGSALGSAAGRSALAGLAPAAATALARLAVGGDGAATEALTHLAGSCREDGALLLPPPTLALLVRAPTPRLSPIFGALAATPAGADALLRAVHGGATPWPVGVPIQPLPPLIANALAADALGSLWCGRATTPGALAAAAASRASPPALTALAAVGVDAAALADAWFSTGAAWVPAPLQPSPAWGVCAAAAALAALHPSAVSAAADAAVAGVSPSFTPPAVPSPPPSLEAVAAVHATHGEAIARLLVE